MISSVYTRDGLDIRKSRDHETVINPTRENREIVERLNFKHLEFNASMGLLPRSLKFLESWNFIEGISIVWAPPTLEIGVINSLSNLKSFRMAIENSSTIDLRNLTNLSDLGVRWSKKIINIDQCKALSTLRLWKYPNDDLQYLREVNCLRKLELIQSKITSLRGIEVMKELEKASFTANRKLRSLGGIEQSMNLKSIDWDGSHISDLTPLETCAYLEMLVIHNGKEIDSIKPLTNLKRLNYILITGNTTILDGDMTPALGRNDCQIRPRKNYSHNPDEIDRINGTVRPPVEIGWYHEKTP